MKEILNFIEVFRNESTEELFTECACYWFSRILVERFGGDIMYSPGEIHFATEIYGTLYDITGEIESEGYIPWESYNLSDRDEIYESCILLRGGE